MDFGPSKRFIELTMGLVIFLYFIFTSRECTGEEINPCISRQTCGKCIQKDPRCAWCSQENITEKKISRCDFYENLLQKNCTDAVSPNSTTEIVVNLSLSEKKTILASAVQIRPQEMKIQLRPNSPETFSVEFRQVVDYPVDVYYLMDVSQSMKEHKKTLIGLSEKIANNIPRISLEFTIGAGSFVDKKAALNKRSTTFKNTIPEHALRRHMRLGPSPSDFAKKVSEFSKEVDNTETLGNSPVGTLDAIMQAIVCKETIGWRPKAKKILVIATGNDFHYAGDGKLSGIISPNDGQCHLNSEGNYSEQDYPSLSQINRKIKEHNFTIIFAVTEDQMGSYSNLSSRLVGSETTNLSSFADVMRHISEQYKAMSSSIEMRDTTGGSGNIKISYNSTCLDGVNRERSVCREVKQEDTVTFNITIEFSSCPDNESDRKSTIEIFPVGRISNLSLHLEMICDCNCMNTRKEVQDQVCSGRGLYECGICRCNNNTYGKECECDGIENQIGPVDSECKRSRGKDEWVCSNRGECRCGKCMCKEGEHPEEKYSGKYCECSNYNCYKVNNKTCNGHGICECGRCRCNEGWSGPDCTCSNSTENCLVQSNGAACSGHGNCYCGSCKCDETYYGQFCEDCPSCPGKCEEYGICVECVFSSRDDKLPETKCKVCKEKMIIVELVDTVEVNETIQEKACSIEDEEGCHVFFKYEKVDNISTIIYAQKWKECPSPPDVVAIVCGTIGSIIAAGLLLLLMWKLLTYVHDRREFAKFESERKRAHWDSGQNPIFIQPTSTYENPVYKRS